MDLVLHIKLTCYTVRKAERYRDIEVPKLRIMLMVLIEKLFY